MLERIVAILLIFGLSGCALEIGGDPEQDAGDLNQYDGGSNPDADNGEPADAGDPAGDQAGCTDECSQGQGICDGSGIRYCGNHDADACLEWSPREDCPGGMVCRENACVEPCSDACVQGTRRCDGSLAVESCGDFDGDSCVEWGDRMECGPEEVCDQGACVCQDQCQEIGTGRCLDDATVEVCGDFDSDVCLEWGGAAACNQGQMCSQGACVCDGLCQQGERRCSQGGSATYQVCADGNGDGCPEWGGEVPCGSQMVCEAGQCVIPCGDDCQVAGALRCSDSAEGTEVCGHFDSDECLEWGGFSACQEGFVCLQGQCRCTHSCPSPGARRCLSSGPGEYEICGDHDGDGCLEWGGEYACNDGMICDEGECVYDCSDVCQAGDLRCVDPPGVEVCGNHDLDPCTEWGGLVACDADQLCQDGQCVCQNPCLLDARECVGDQAYRLCTDPDGNGCTQWGAPVGCGPLEACQAGNCEAVCQHDCPAQGDLRCAPGVEGYEVCSDFDADPCLEWGGLTQCQAEQVCQQGQCVCVDQCSPGGTTQCSDPQTYQVCGDYDNDVCLEWGSGIACNQGQVCSQGSCQCENPCQLGEHRCVTGQNAAETCGDYNGDGCLEWGNLVACGSQKICENGICVDDCTDECQVSGQAECVPGQNAWRECGQFDNDSCTEWSSWQFCEQDQACEDGACVCVDLCFVDGALQCASGQDAYQVCGDFDSNGCMEWGPPVDCQTGWVCSDTTGECIRPYPSGPYGTSLGSTIANECLEEVICDGPAPEGSWFCLENFLARKATMFTVHTGW